MTRYLARIYKIDVPFNGLLRDDLTEATEDWLGKLGADKCFHSQAQANNLTDLGEDIARRDSPKCGNCGNTPAKYCIVTEGNERMPGYLCSTCAKVHNAEIEKKVGDESNGM